MNSSPLVEVGSPDLHELTNDALSGVADILDDYVIFPSPEARDAVILWAAHTHVFTAFESTPRLSIYGNEPGCGKSRVLEVLEHLVPAPLYAISMTPGTMWRTIEHEAPTLLFDEVDTIWGQNGSSSAYQTLRAIINAGHRAGGTIPRCVGAEDVKRFNVFAPIAMAGLGDVPDTIRTRSVRVRMRKRRPGQEVRPFRFKYAQDALSLARTALETWAIDAADVLEFSCPEMPVTDRDADVWEPLVAIAELAGDEWAERARRACEELTAAESPGKAPSPGMRLLSALSEVWPTGEPVASTEVLLNGLYGLTGEGYRPDTLHARSLANILREYKIHPTTVRVDGTPVKGYKRSTLAEVWQRYGLGVTV